MTPQQIQNKIADLDFWLTSNPEHPDYSTVLHQKWELERVLTNNEKE